MSSSARWCHLGLSLVGDSMGFNADRLIRKITSRPLMLNHYEPHTADNLFPEVEVVIEVVVVDEEGEGWGRDEKR